VSEAPARNAVRKTAAACGKRPQTRVGEASRTASVTIASNGPATMLTLSPGVTRIREIAGVCHSIPRTGGSTVPRIAPVQSDSGRSWGVGAIANDHVLTVRDGWVRLNWRANRTGPWRPGDVVDGQAFTGEAWVALPGAWLPDPYGRHQLRWWTGRFWSSQAQTNGKHYNDPGPSVPTAVTPASKPVFGPLPPRRRPRRGRWDDTIGAVLFCGFWVVVALISAEMAITDGDPDLFRLTGSAAINIVLFALTGKTRGEVRKGVLSALADRSWYIAAGAILAGGAWLSLRFDAVEVLYLAVVLFLLLVMVART